jgi:ABC-type amino acid transport substrate-binding protein
MSFGAPADRQKFHNQQCRSRLVIPAEAGIQVCPPPPRLDTRFRGHDVGLSLVCLNKLTRLFTKSVILTALLMGLASVRSAFAADDLEGTLKKIRTSGTFTIGYRDAAPPFSFAASDKQPAGYSVDLCKRVAGAVQKRLGMTDLKVTWVPVTAENRIEMVVQGKIDIECGTTTATLSRQERVDFSLMTFVDGGSLLTTSRTDVRELGDFAGKRIAVIPGTTTEKALADFLKKKAVAVKVVPVKDHPEGLKAIEDGAADAFASDRGILIGLAMAAKDPTRFFLANILFSYEPYGLVLRRGDPEFRLVVNRALAQLYRSGDIEPIYDRWFGAFGKGGEAIHIMYMLNGLPE